MIYSSTPLPDYITLMPGYEDNVHWIQIQCDVDAKQPQQWLLFWDEQSPDGCTLCVEQLTDDPDRRMVEADSIAEGLNFIRQQFHQTNDIPPQTLGDLSLFLTYMQETNRLLYYAEETLQLLRAHITGNGSSSPSRG